MLPNSLPYQRAFRLAYFLLVAPLLLVLSGCAVGYIPISVEQEPPENVATLKYNRAHCYSEGHKPTIRAIDGVILDLNFKSWWRLGTPSSAGTYYVLAGNHKIDYTIKTVHFKTEKVRYIGGYSSGTTGYRQKKITKNKKRSFTQMFEGGKSYKWDNCSCKFIEYDSKKEAEQIHNSWGDDGFIQ